MKYNVPNIAKKAVLDSIKNTAHIGVGFSGGSDSTALLITLASLRKAPQVTAIIIDHDLQKGSQEVAEKAANIARQLGFNAVIRNANVQTTKNGLEADARAARYKCFEDVAHTYNLDKILLGHTVSDQAEQVLMGLLRGSGTKSISGMPKNRDLYSRPFLDTLNATDTVDICKLNKIPYWEDPMNTNVAYTRVMVRNLLSNLNIETALVKTASIAAEDDQALQDLAQSAYANTNWHVSNLPTTPAIRKRMYKMALDDIGAKANFEQLNNIDRLVTDYHGQKEIYVTHGYVIRKNKVLHFERESNTL